MICSFRQIFIWIICDGNTDDGENPVYSDYITTLSKYYDYLSEYGWEISFTFT